MKAFRIIIDFTLLILVFWLPWWIVGLITLACMFIFDSYYEILVFAVIIDSLSSLPLSRFYHIQFVVTISALVLFALTQAIKRRLRMYT